MRSKLGGWVERRPTAAAAALYALLALVMFAPGLAPGRTLSASDYLWTATPWEASRPAEVPGLGSNQEQADAATQFQPALMLTRAALPDIPLWDPHTLSGRPFLGDPQSSVFSPFSVPAYVLPFWKSLALIAMLKVFVAALGAFLLAKELRMRFGGALMSGLVFGFSLWSVTWVAWPHTSVWALLPWICLMSERCVRRPGPLPFAGLALATGLGLLGGHPASSYQVTLVVALFWIVRVLAAKPLRERIGVRLLTFGAALVVGTALAAVALIPFVELLGRSSDATARAEASDVLHQPARYLWGLFLYDYWGHARTSLQFGTGLQERAFYVGALPLVLTLAALVSSRARERIAVFAVGAAALAIATGISPVYDLALLVPGLDAANNGRFAIVTVLCLAVLAGWGLDDLTAASVPARRRLATLGGGLLLLVLPVLFVLIARDTGRGALGDGLRVAWGFESPAAGAAAVIRMASLLEWLVLAGAALVLVFLRLRGRVGVPAFVVLALVLVSADLFKAGMGYNPAIERDNAVQPATPAIRYLQEQRPARFAALEVKRALSLAYPLPPNVGMRYGLNDVRGYVIPTERRYFNLWRKVIAPSRDCPFLFCTQSAPARPRELRALGLLGVGHLLQNPGDPRLEGLRLAYDGPDARVYENPGALPRAFLVNRQVVARDADAALAAATASDFPARAAAVTERRLAGLPEGGAAGSERAGSARISADERERVVVDADARGRALLVLTDSWYPGWKATVDGEPAEVERVNYVTRGVKVPAGRHRVEFRYEPASWRVGWIVSLLALLVIAAAAAAGLRARGRRATRVGATACMFGG